MRHSEQAYQLVAMDRPKGYGWLVSKSEILEQLPNLERGDCREILERIWEMEEAELLKGVQPDADEKALLDNELREYHANPNVGSEWKEVESRLRRQIRQ